MNLKTEFTEIDCEYFRRSCNFTPEEMAVFNLRVRDKTITQIAMLLCMSEPTVNRRIKSIKRKILRVI